MKRPDLALPDKFFATPVGDGYMITYKRDAHRRWEMFSTDYDLVFRLHFKGASLLSRKELRALKKLVIERGNYILTK